MAGGGGEGREKKEKKPQSPEEGAGGRKSSLLCLQKGAEGGGAGKSLPKSPLLNGLGMLGGRRLVLQVFESCY